MSATFYDAIGARPSAQDVAITRAVGQRHVLVPAGSAAAQLFRSHADMHIILDSGAWPPANPRRMSLTAYAAELLSWRRGDGDYGPLDWCASYDHIGDPARTARDHQRLLALLADAGAADCPLVPVVHYPGPALATILLDIDAGTAGTRADLVDSDGSMPTRPCYALGGLVPPLRPTAPARSAAAATDWATALLRDMGDATDQIDPDLLRLHLFGVGRPALVQGAPFVASYDSSGPAQQARFGWQKIRPSYRPEYGYTPAKLQVSRAARLAYWLTHYRAQAGVASQQIDARDLPDDTRTVHVVEHSLFDLLA